MQNCMESARILREGLDKMGGFEIVSKEKGVPLVAFSIKGRNKSLAFKLSDNLRRFGWIVPAYTLPANAEHITVLRVVVREDFGRPMVEKFLSHLEIGMNEINSAVDVLMPRIRFTVELRPSEEDVVNGDVFSVPKAVIVAQQVDPVEKSIPLVGRKTKGVC